MRLLLKVIFLTVAGIAASSLGASMLVLVLVASAETEHMVVNSEGVVEAAASRIPAIFVEWLTGLLEPGMGVDWGGENMDYLLGMVLQSARLVGATLMFSTLIAVLWIAMDVYRGRRSTDTSFFGAATLMAPPVVWAAGVTLGINAVVSLVLAKLTGMDVSHLQFPLAVDTMRWSAAILVLSFGGGTLWHLHNGLLLDLEQVLHKDFVLVARANGLGVFARTVRNLAVPAATRVVERIPILLGEVIVVEYIFFLDGTGRELFKLLDRRDAPALMTVTFVFVLLTMSSRGLVRLLAAWLTPQVTEEVA